MPTHALLGATGATGSAILRTLLSQPTPASAEPLHLNIYVRSREKLLTLFPTLLTPSSIHITIFAGAFTDPPLLTACLADATIIYNCIATNTLSPQQNLAQRSAQAILAALRDVRAERGAVYVPPVLLFNRTIGMNPAVENPVPKVLGPVLEWALDWAFEDLRAACGMYVAAAAGAGSGLEEGEGGGAGDGGWVDEARLLRYVFIDPPKILAPNGTERTGYVLVREGKVRPALYYADLGDAFVEVASRCGDVAEGKGKFVDCAVGVSARGRVAESWWDIWEAIGLLGRGIMFRVLGI